MLVAQPLRHHTPTRPGERPRDHQRMNQQHAIDLLTPAIPNDVEAPIWADLGAGEGTFTRALARLLGRGEIYAVEREDGPLRALTALARRLDGTTSTARVHVVRGDFTEELMVPEANGFLLANALHYVPTEEQPAALARLAVRLRRGGRIVLIEYHRRSANPWVPYPISRDALVALARDAGLEPPQVVSTAPSLFGPELYAAVLATPR
jgi:SAM-dependent methyltransferase